jgi:hypothetical protein
MRCAWLWLLPQTKLTAAVLPPEGGRFPLLPTRGPRPRFRLAEITISPMSTTNDLAGINYLPVTAAKPAAQAPKTAIVPRPT